MLRVISVNHSHPFQGRLSEGTVIATITSPSKALFDLYPVLALETMHNELDSTTAFQGLTACMETDMQK